MSHLGLIKGRGAETYSGPMQGVRGPFWAYTEGLEGHVGHIQVARRPFLGVSRETGAEVLFWSI